MYTGKKYSGMKSSVCFALKFAISPFSPHLPFGVQISKQNRHRTFHTRIFFTGVVFLTTHLNSMSSTMCYYTCTLNQLCLIPDISLFTKCPQLLLQWIFTDQIYHPLTLTGTIAGKKYSVKSPNPKLKLDRIFELHNLYHSSSVAS